MWLILPPVDQVFQRRHGKHALRLRPEIGQEAQDSIQLPPASGSSCCGFHLPTLRTGKRARVHQGHMRFGHQLDRATGRIQRAAQPGRDVDGQDLRIGLSQRPVQFREFTDRRLRSGGHLVRAFQQIVKIIRCNIHPTGIGALSQRHLERREMDVKLLRHLRRQVRSPIGHDLHSHSPSQRLPAAPPAKLTFQQVHGQMNHRRAAVRAGAR